MISGRAGSPFPLFFLSSGVDLFFVISGFIMVYSSETLFASPGGAYTFLARRIGRIVPLYWITTAVAVPLMSLRADWQSTLGSLLFFPYTNSNGSVTPLNGVGWTLNFEMFFYVLFASVIFWPRKVAVPVLVAILVLVVCLGSVFAPQTTALRYWSDPIVLEFAFGMIIATIYRRQQVRLPNWLRIALILGSVFSIWMTNQFMPPSHFRALMWGVPASTVVAATLLGKQPEGNGYFASFVNLLGNSSYSLYLVHPLVGALIIIYWSTTSLHTYPMRLVLFATYIGAVAVSVVVFLLVEKPATLSLRRISERSSKIPILQSK
jgi:peptidoglycan/LPS O-acetylase OafA/YrhL